jgi:zinc transport system ATP-binding protein
MTKEAIRVENLNIKLGKRKIIKNAEFTIDKGDLVFLIGANGSGKTTLIKALLGLIDYDGNIYIKAQKLSKKIIAENLGYVPQYSSIDRDFPLTVEEMIRLECELSPKCDISIDEHLEIFDAKHLKNKQISNLSGGEFQKALIVRSLASSPDIILMDEPVNNLDETSQRNLLRFVRKLNQENNKTILFISHDYNLIKHETEEKILFIENKKITQETEQSLMHKSHFISSKANTDE